MEGIPGSRSRLLQVWLPVVTLVGGALSGLHVYLDQQKQEAMTRRIEARKPFLEKQLSLYQKISLL